MEQEVAALIAAVALATVHLFSGKLLMLRGVPRSRWLSAFAGVSVAYVFVHLLPELAEGQAAIEEREALAGFLEHHVYLVALAGLGAFYAIEQHSLRSRRRASRAAEERQTGSSAFWVSIASFAAYNVIVGYLLLRGDLDELHALALYAFAIGVHFVINDFGLREHHRDRYDRSGRWIVSAAILVGCSIGLVTDLPEHTVSLTIAFIGGGVVLNVMKEELPGERQARVLPFALGGISYAALLQLL